MINPAGTNLEFSFAMTIFNSSGESATSASMRLLLLSSGTGDRAPGPAANHQPPRLPSKTAIVDHTKNGTNFLRTGMASNGSAKTSLSIGEIISVASPPPTKGSSTRVRLSGSKVSNCLTAWSRAAASRGRSAGFGSVASKTNRSNPAESSAFAKLGAGTRE